MNEGSAVNVTGTGTVNAGVCTYRGFSLGSTAGADVVIYDSADGNNLASATVLASFTLAAKGHTGEDIQSGVRCTRGIYVTATAAVQGHVRIG